MWFIGYDLDEPTPNHSVLSKARSRYGKKVFEQFFQKILEQCIKTGLVKGEKVYMDSTYILADAAINSIVPRPKGLLCGQDAVELPLSSKEYVEKVFAENPVPSGTAPLNEEIREGAVEDDKPVEVKEQKLPEKIDNTKSKKPKMEERLTKNYHPSSNKTHFSKTDPECSIVSHMSTNAPRTPARLAYKEHFTVDEHKRVITAVKVTPGAIADEALLTTLIKEQPCPVKEVCADTKYGTYDNYKYLYARGITPTIPPWIPSGPKTPGRIYKKEYAYDLKTDTYTCPAGKKLTLGKDSLTPNLTKYLSRKEDCRNCVLSAKCLSKNRARRTIYRHSDDIFRARVMEHLLTDDARKTMRQRKTYAEWVNAESKTKHGLRRAMFRGLEQVTIQVMMTASVQNLKRLIAQMSASTQNFKELYSDFCNFMTSLLKQPAFA